MNLTTLDQSKRLAELGLEQDVRPQMVWWDDRVNGSALSWQQYPPLTLGEVPWYAAIHPVDALDWCIGKQVRWERTDDGWWLATMPDGTEVAGNDAYGLLDAVLEQLSAGHGDERAE